MSMRLPCRDEPFPRAASLPCAQARSALSLGPATKPQGRGQPLLGGRKALLPANRAAEGVENIPCAASGRASGAALQHVPCRHQTRGSRTCWPTGMRGACKDDDCTAVCCSPRRIQHAPRGGRCEAATRHVAPAASQAPAAGAEQIACHELLTKVCTLTLPMRLYRVALQCGGVHQPERHTAAVH